MHLWIWTLNTRIFVVKKKSENIVKHWTDKVKLLVETFVQMTKDAPTSPQTKKKDDAEEKVDESTMTKVEFTEEELKEKFEMSKIEDEICVLEDSRDKAKNKINMGAIQEYFSKEAEYQTQMKELESITEKRDDARNKHDSLRKKRLEMFSTGFFKIKMKLKEMYRMLTLGGDAELEQVDTLDPFSEGILFSVRPPRKVGRASQIFLERRHFALSRWCLRFIISGPLPCTSWTRSMLRWTSKMSPLLQITLRTELTVLSSL